MRNKPDIYLEGLRKITKIYRQLSPHQAGDSNPAPTMYDSEASPTEPACSASTIWEGKFLTDPGYIGFVACGTVDKVRSFGNRECPLLSEPLGATKPTEDQ
jgi:hypothetical protein